jgi:acid phosphatase (class A)
MILHILNRKITQLNRPLTIPSGSFRVGFSRYFVPLALFNFCIHSKVQADRTPEQVERAKRVANQSVTSFAQSVLGEWFHSGDFPRTQAVFDEIERERRDIVDDQVKRRWNRTRPYLYSSAVHPVVSRPDNTSYPSGHSAAAAVWGTILAAAFPEKAAEFRKQIHEVMWSRVLGGVHYPSDTVAGEMLGEAIANAMMKSPDMQAALKTIREEVGPRPDAASKVAAQRQLSK